MRRAPSWEDTQDEYISCSCVQIEGRAVSDSDEDEGDGANPQAMAAAVRDAELDGATVERIESSAKAGKHRLSPFRDLLP